MGSAAFPPDSPELPDSTSTPSPAAAVTGDSGVVRDAAQRAYHALAAHFHTRLLDTGELEAAVCGYVDALRDEGAPPERMLIAVKRLIARSRAPGWGAETDEQRALTEQVIACCIEEYYRGAGSGSRPG